MPLKDIINGPEWLLWIVFSVFVLLSIVLLTGHGANLITGYNTSSEEEKNKYDEKKLCRVTGAGVAVISVLIFIMAKWNSVLPSSFIFVFIAVTLVVCAVMIILLNTICKKK